MMLDPNAGAVSTSSPEWSELVSVASLFEADGPDLVEQVTLIAEHGAHVLYPSIDAAGEIGIGLSFFVTVDTAIRVNKSLLKAPDISAKEKTFRVELDAVLESKRTLSH